MQFAFDEFIQALADYLGLDARQLALSQELVVDGLEVGFMQEGADDEDPGDFVFFSRLGTPLPVHAAAVYKVLLEANSLWLGTAGFTLGLHAGSGDVLLCGRVPLDPAPEPQAFMPLLTQFVATAQMWRGYIDGSLEMNGELPDDQVAYLA